MGKTSDKNHPFKPSSITVLLVRLLNALKSFDFSAKQLVNWGAVALLLLSLSVIFGWYGGYPRLIQISPAYVPMQFNTAFGFGWAGLSLWSLNYQRWAIAKFGSIVLLLLGVLTLTQYIFRLNFGIDELFIDHYILVETSHPGRMAPNTALNFSLSGVAIALILHRKLTLNAVFIASTLGALIMGLSFVAFFGYLSGVETAYGWGRLTQMALHTSAGFLLVGLSLLTVIRQISLAKFRKLPQLLLPVVAGIFGFTITIALWQALTASELKLQQQYGVTEQNFIAESILIVGGTLALCLAFTLWLTGKFRQKIEHLQEAQQRILQLNNQLKELSYLDALTGIPNRRMFDLTLHKEWGRAIRQQSAIALIFIDVDYFKLYNDFYGHQQGDVCLQHIAEVISHAARRTTDLAARYGGEEFVILLPDATQQYAEAIATDLIERIKHLKLPHARSKIASIITMSAGISLMVPQQTTSCNVLLEAADQALYQAKAAGRDQVIFRKA